MIIMPGLACYLSFMLASEFTILFLHSLLQMLVGRWPLKEYSSELPLFTGLLAVHALSKQCFLFLYILNIEPFLYLHAALKGTNMVVCISVSS